VLTRAAVGRSGPDAVRAIAAAYRRRASITPAGTPPPSTRAERRRAFQQVADDAVAVLFDAIAGSGLSCDRAIDAVRAIRAIPHWAAACNG
jgi:hypothetical protein